MIVKKQLIQKNNLLVSNQIFTFAIHTLGCKVNAFESNAIVNDLLENGLIKVSFNEIADIYIINTCSVTNKADSKSKFFINQAYKKNPNAIIIVAGCMSQLDKKLSDKLNVSIQIGNKYKGNIFALIEDYLKKKERIINIENLLIKNEFEIIKPSIFSEQTRAFCKIQDGCNYMCSYCIIPFSRGKQRSKPLNLVIDEIRYLVSKNYKEIVLIGVNTAGYEDDDKNNFLDLLKAINKLEGDFRIRISSVEPFQINDKIIELVSKNKKRFCQHWHICLQSGSNDVLKEMNRKYTAKYFLELIKKIKKLSPNACFTTDYIVGFPTETSNHHEESKKLLKKINFLDMHIFPFSPRKGTKAFLLKDNGSKIKKDRFKEIEKINQECRDKILNSFINKKVLVLCESKVKESSHISGYSSEYIKVYIKSNEDLKNQFVTVKLISKFLDGMYGKIVFLKNK